MPGPEPLAERSGPYSPRARDPRTSSGNTIHRRAARGRAGFECCTRRGRKTMSKNFELMQQTGRGPEMTPIPSQIPQKPLSVSHANGNGHRNGNGAGLNLDDLAQEETLKLVQRVFLLQAGGGSGTGNFSGRDDGEGWGRG